MDTRLTGDDVVSFMRTLLPFLESFNRERLLTHTLTSTEGDTLHPRRLFSRIGHADDGRRGGGESEGLRRNAHPRGRGDSVPAEGSEDRLDIRVQKSDSTGSVVPIGVMLITARQR